MVLPGCTLPRKEAPAEGASIRIPPGSSGAFSYFLLRGLNGDADDDNDGKISSGELFEYVRAKVRESTSKRQTPRDLGDLPRDTVLIGDTHRPGIELADWKPLDNVLAQRRQTGTAPVAVPANASNAKWRL